MGQSSRATVSVWVPYVLASCTAVSILSTDLFTPSIPDLVTALGTDVATAQYTVSINLAAYAIAQLFHGPVADAFGRRRLLLIAFGFFVCFSIFSALSVSIEMLLLGRFLQGLASSVPSVVIVLIIREIYPPKDAVGVMGLYGAALGIAPAIGPLLGGYLHVWFGWQASFWIIAGLAAFVAVLFHAQVPETLRDRHRLHLGTALRTYGQLLVTREYLASLAPLAMVFGGFYAFVTTGPVVFIKLLGLPTERYGMTYIFIIVSFIIGNVVANRMNRRTSPLQISRIAMLVALIGALSMLIPVLAGLSSLWAILGSMCVYAMGLGIIMASGPIVLLDAVEDLPQGPASALLGSCQLGAAALAGFLSGTFYNDSPLSLAATLSGFALLGAVVMFSSVSPEARLKADEPFRD